MRDLRQDSFSFFFLPVSYYSFMCFSICPYNAFSDTPCIEIVDLYF